MGTIESNLQSIKKSLPENITLVAVTKTKPVSDIQKAYDAGHRDFGENKVQEMVAKYEGLPKDITWHMIGHLQRNKVKYMAGFVNLIHGVDSIKTLKEIDKQAKKHQRVIDCLLQAKIAREERKYGMSFSEIEAVLVSEEYTSLQHVHVVGCMGMATFTDDETQLEKEFSSLHIFFDQIKKKYPELTVLSMGMSGDYPLAVKNGSTMIRVGSAIFGARNYIT